MLWTLLLLLSSRTSGKCLQQVNHNLYLAQVGRCWWSDGSHYYPYPSCLDDMISRLIAFIPHFACVDDLISWISLPFSYLDSMISWLGVCYLSKWILLKLCKLVFLTWSSSSSFSCCSLVCDLTLYVSIMRLLDIFHPFVSITCLPFL